MGGSIKASASGELTPDLVSRTVRSSRCARHTSESAARLVEWRSPRL